MAHVRPGKLTLVEYRGYTSWLFVFISIYSHHLQAGNWCIYCITSLRVNHPLPEVKILHFARFMFLQLHYIFLWPNY